MNTVITILGLVAVGYFFASTVWTLYRQFMALWEFYEPILKRRIEALLRARDDES